jgi:uridylate kinase
VYKRVLLKISGEALASVEKTHTKAFGISQYMLDKIANDVKSALALGVQVCIVVGGGNIYRGVQGASEHGIDRATSDYMGMMATIINGVALASALENNGVPSRLMSAIPVQLVAEPYIRSKALSHMQKGRVVVFAGGTGNPFFTTDTAATLRAVEMNCDVLFKATKVPGIYDKDPVKHKDAVFMGEITATEVLNKKLNVMDATAIALARENNLPIVVFSMYEDDSFAKVMTEKTQYTIVKEVTNV